MRVVVARRIGRLGGLGNELIPWSKGWIASQVLQAKLVGPSWGMNKFKYYRNFGTSRADFLVEDLLTHLPRFDFTEADYREIGEIDFGRSIECYAQKRGLTLRKSFILTVEGMYGGYPAIESARQYILSTLLKSRNTLKNMFAFNTGLDQKKLFVAVHYRTGKDLRTVEPGESARGRFVIRIPVEWYIKCCESLQSALGDSVQFRIFTDRGGPDFDELVRRFNPGQQRQSGLTEVSDLLLLSQADLCISSISSYSLMASFLSGNPYLWYEPQLVQKGGGLSIWGHEPAQSQPGGLTYENTQAIQARVQAPHSDPAWQSSLRGYPVDMTGRLPDGVVARLKQTLLEKDRTSDLLAYGAVPEWVAVAVDPPAAK